MIMTQITINVSDILTQFQLFYFPLSFAELQISDLKLLSHRLWNNIASCEKRKKLVQTGFTG